MDTVKTLSEMRAANRAMNKAAQDAIAMSEMLTLEKVKDLRRIHALEAALREIAALGDVDCDTAPSIAKQALQKSAE